MGQNYYLILTLLLVLSQLCTSSLIHTTHPIVDCCKQGKKYINKLFSLKGGNVGSQTTAITPKNITILISTSIGSSFLDKSKKISVSPNATVHDVKRLIKDKFPGSPPPQLQRLFHSFQPLKDSDIVGNITSITASPILLDMISGTSSYNRTMSISQALEAYVSTIVHQTYLSMAINKAFQIKDGVDSTIDATTEDMNKIETLALRELFEIVNETVYTQYSKEIATALELEKDPSVLTTDTYAWRGNQGKRHSPLVTAWAKQFSTNKQIAYALAYYSVILVVFAKFATSATNSKKFLYLMVPLLWVSKFRQFRIVSKLLVNTLLQLAPYVDFIMPLLPAPYQVIAQKSKLWKSSSSTDSTTKKEKKITSLLNSNGDDDDKDEVYEDEDENDNNDSVSIVAVKDEKHKGEGKDAKSAERKTPKRQVAVF